MFEISTGEEYKIVFSFFQVIIAYDYFLNLSFNCLATLETAYSYLDNNIFEIVRIPNPSQVDQNNIFEMVTLPNCPHIDQNFYHILIHVEIIYFCSLL